jgi:hypothetical protein
MSILYDRPYRTIGVETLPISEQRILDKVSGTTYKVSNHTKSTYKVLFMGCLDLTIWCDLTPYM